MKKIPLSQNKFALIDNGDYDALSNHKWYASKDRNSWYATRKIRIASKKITVRMHRVILGLKCFDGKEVDHIDGNGLNNQRSNLRTCTNQQNHFNQRPQKKKKSSRFKGVYRHKEVKKWSSQIKINGRKINLGCFIKEVDAAKAYNEGALKYFGEFARPNII